MPCYRLGQIWDKTTYKKNQATIFNGLIFRMLPNQDYYIVIPNQLQYT